MKSMLSVMILASTLCNIPAQTKNGAATLLNGAIENTRKAFLKLQTNDLAVSFVDLSERNNLGSANFRGDIPIYPASVVKLFYLEATHRWLSEGRIKDHPELRRAMRDMIVDSYNEATHYVLDVLTDTTSGPALATAEMEVWMEKRNAVNRYLLARGFLGINANQKPWCEGPYGRDRIFVGQAYTNRNALTTETTARLFREIIDAKTLSRERCDQMLELLRRDPFAKSSDPDDQAHGFTGTALPKGAKLWSKAGWTSETRHDAACVELPNGRKFILVTFTVNHASEREIIPTLAREIISGLQ
jgi:hypothetical protein